MNETISPDERREDAPLDAELPKRECETPAPRRWQPALEPTCCGSGCIDCPF